MKKEMRISRPSAPPIDEIYDLFFPLQLQNGELTCEANLSQFQKLFNTQVRQYSHDLRRFLVNALAAAKRLSNGEDLLRLIHGAYLAALVAGQLTNQNYDQGLADATLRIYNSTIEILKKQSDDKDAGIIASLYCGFYALSVVPCDSWQAERQLFMNDCVYCSMRMPEIFIPEFVKMVAAAMENEDNKRLATLHCLYMESFGSEKYMEERGIVNSAINHINLMRGLECYGQKESSMSGMISERFSWFVNGAAKKRIFDPDAAELLKEAIAILAGPEGHKGLYGEAQKIVESWDNVAVNSASARTAMSAQYTAQLLGRLNRD